MKKFPFIKTAPLFDKRALGQARRVVGGGRIPPNQKLFLTLLIQIKKEEFFWKRALFNGVSNPWMLFLPETGPDPSATMAGLLQKMTF